MSNAIDIAWASCHIKVDAVNAAGWCELQGIPSGLATRAAARLLALGASTASVVTPCSVKFRAKKHIVSQLVEVFPCCPLAVS